MVDTIKKRLHRGPISTKDPNNDSHHRCLSNRLGSTFTQQHNSRLMVPFRIQHAHKLAGANGNPQHMQSLSTSNKKQSHQDPHGQCSVHVLHKLPEGCKITIRMHRSDMALELVYQQQHPHVGILPPGMPKLNSLKLRFCTELRMGDRSQCSTYSIQKMGIPYHRPLSTSTECRVTMILLQSRIASPLPRRHSPRQMGS